MGKVYTVVSISEMPITRRIDGKTYTRSTMGYKLKSWAKAHADRARKKGRLVRVIQVRKSVYVVYQRKK
jgi:hypothetical protein